MGVNDGKYLVAFFAALFLVLCIAFSTRNHIYTNQGIFKRAGLAPCGEVCSYKGLIKNVGKEFQSINQDINCVNIMRRMGYRNHTIEYPPPKSPPKDLSKAFTQYGYMPMVHERYMVQFNPKRASKLNIFSLNKINSLINSTVKGDNVNVYNDGGCVKDVISKYQKNVLGSSSVVIGTRSPWLEAILLANGAANVTTLEYAELRLEHPKIISYTPYTYAELYLQRKTPFHDFGASFSSLEHSGLGRYGDPINPYGDLEAMAQIWCMLKPGGIFILGIPFSNGEKGDLTWNAHRIYGTKRLEHMMANWKFLESSLCKDKFHHIVLVMKKLV